VYEFRELVKGVKFSKNDLILDIGCGNGLQTALLARGGYALGIDISEKAIATAKSRAAFFGRASFYMMCVEQLNNSFNDSFDKVFSICVIEHIPDYLSTLKEGYRVLKPSGQFIFSVDSLETITDRVLIEKHRKVYAVEHYFRKEQLESDLQQIGFNKIEVYSIFGSEFAKNLFMKGVKSGFRYNYLESILNYFFLRHNERHCTSHKGIFLVARCSK
jgi:SAM-dependent methyltransferase